MISIAETGLLIIFSIMLIIHVGVLMKWIPYSFIWGGRLQTDKEMYQFETVSVFVTLICLWIACERLSITNMLPQRYKIMALWVMAVIFLINTITNLLSKNKAEKMIFAPLTILLTLICITLALN